MFSIFSKKLWTKDLLAWYLYDFANSFITINMTLYFSQWAVVDQKLSDFWFSVSFVVPTFILIFISTYIGSLGDKDDRHSSIFIWTTSASFASVVAMLVFAKLLTGFLAVVVVLFFYAVYQFFIQLALVPYYAFIKHIGDREIYGKVSGLGFTFSQIGNILGLLLTLPIVNGSITFFGKGHLATLPPALIVFIIFFLPSFLVFRNRKFKAIVQSPAVDIGENKSIWKVFVNNLKESRRYPGVLPLLLAFYLFSDAITTLSIYSAIYLQNVFNVVDAIKVNIYIFILVGFGIGSLVGGIISDRYSHKPTLIVSLLINAMTIFVVALNTNADALSFIFSVFGLTMGVVYASSRSYLASLVPIFEGGTFFGLYTFAERFASIVGPLVWGIIIFLFKDNFPTNYRIAAFAMGFLVLLGSLPLLYKNKSISWQKSL